MKAEVDVFEEKIEAITCRSRHAATKMAKASASDKNEILVAIAAALERDADSIIAANGQDMAAARSDGVSPSIADRLMLDTKRIEALSEAVRAVIDLPDPISEVIRGSVLPNGLESRQIRVPLGVVGVIYEARPNVTVDVAVLALKSGNSVILRGGSLAANTNRQLIQTMQKAIAEVGFDPDSVQTIDTLGRQGTVALMKAQGKIDVLVPRGGRSLIQTVLKESTVPVIETGEGNVHIFVDKTAASDMVLDIVVNAKLQRPSVCNAVETLLVHQEYPDIVDLLASLHAAGVSIHADSRAMTLYSGSVSMVEATETDWWKEYHGPDLAVKLVAGIEEAVEHIAKYSSRHTEAILTADIFNAQRFTKEVDAAAVVVNASTRFVDGGELGLGAELGISTQKLHARGPMGLTELTSTKWIVTGTGQIRM